MLFSLHFFVFLCCFTCKFVYVILGYLWAAVGVMAQFFGIPREVFFSKIVLRNTLGGDEVSSEDCECEEFATLLNLRLLNKAWHVAISSTLEYQALRLVETDLQDMHSWDWISNDPHEFLVGEFPRNMQLLQKSRRLTVKISPRIVQAALETLSTVELVILRNALCQSWLDVDVLYLKEATTDLQLWITPSNRL
jgi:hypothetical protein